MKNDQGLPVFAIHNPSGGVIDRCHHIRLAFFIYVFFFCNKKFRIHFLTPNQSVKFVFVFTSVHYFGDYEVLAVLFCPNHDHFIRICSYIDDILCTSIIFIISNCLCSVLLIHRKHVTLWISWCCIFFINFEIFRIFCIYSVNYMTKLLYDWYFYSVILSWCWF